MNIQKRIKFPHISLIKPARCFLRFLKIFGFAFVAMFILINLLTDINLSNNEEKKLRQKILQNPFHSSPHKSYARFLLGVSVSAAKNEFALAQDLYDPAKLTENKVLGLSVSPWETWLEIENQNEKIIEEIDYWRQIKNKYPEYLYADLKLVTLNYQIGYKDLARNYLKDLLIKNPTDKNVLDLEKKLE